jgi:hypothetical protein
VASPAAHLAGVPRDELEPQLAGLAPDVLVDLGRLDTRPWLEEAIADIINARLSDERDDEPVPFGGASPEAVADEVADVLSPAEVDAVIVEVRGTDMEVDAAASERATAGVAAVLAEAATTEIITAVHENRVASGDVAPVPPVTTEEQAKRAGLAAFNAGRTLAVPETIPAKLGEAWRAGWKLGKDHAPQPTQATLPGPTVVPAPPLNETTPRAPAEEPERVLTKRPRYFEKNLGALGYEEADWKDWNGVEMRRIIDGKIRRVDPVVASTLAIVDGAEVPAHTDAEPADLAPLTGAASFFTDVLGSPVLPDIMPAVDAHMAAHPWPEGTTVTPFVNLLDTPAGFTEPTAPADPETLEFRAFVEARGAAYEATEAVRAVEAKIDAADHAAGRHADDADPTTNGCAVCADLGPDAPPAPLPMSPELARHLANGGRLAPGQTVRDESPPKYGLGGRSTLGAVNARGDEVPVDWKAAPKNTGNITLPPAPEAVTSRNVYRSSTVPTGGYYYPDNLTDAGRERANTMAKHLRTLADAMPHIVAAQEAQAELEGFGLTVRLVSPAPR